jgi:hypothetical protein
MRITTDERALGNATVDLPHRERCKITQWRSSCGTSTAVRTCYSPSHASTKPSGSPGVDANINVQPVTTEQEATALNFAGSPTLLIDGRDPFLGKAT